MNQQKRLIIAEEKAGLLKERSLKATGSAWCESCGCGLPGGTHSPACRAPEHEHMKGN